MADDVPGAPVAVLGASGRTGSRVVEALAARGRAVRAVTRTSAAPPAARETRAADLEDEGSLVAALEGARAVYVVPPPFRSDEDRLIDSTARAAVRAGVGRVVLHSVIHPHTPALPHHMRKARSAPGRAAALQDQHDTAPLATALDILLAATVRDWTNEPTPPATTR